jgi:hypothetical protein
MQEWIFLPEDGKKKWQRRRLDSLKAIFLMEGGLFKYVYNYISNFERANGKRWLVFSKKEEKAINEIACKFFPATGDRPSIFIGAVLYQLRDCFSIPIYATYITDDPNVPITEASDKQLRLAICIG